MTHPSNPHWAETVRATITTEREKGKSDLAITEDLLAGMLLDAIRMPNRDKLGLILFPEALQRYASMLTSILLEIGWTHPEMTLEGRK
jgi:hypothetical protein